VHNTFAIETEHAHRLREREQLLAAWAKTDGARRGRERPRWPRLLDQVLTRLRARSTPRMSPTSWSVAGPMTSVPAGLEGGRPTVT
jgi:hypothetical protein